MPAPDGVLVQGVAGDAGRAGYLKSVVAMLHGLSMAVYAEGVADPADAQALWDIIHPQGVAVVIEASHSCMTARGVNTPGVMMTALDLVAPLSAAGLPVVVLAARPKVKGELVLVLDLRPAPGGPSHSSNQELPE